MKDKGIPKDVIDELKLKEIPKEITEKSKVIVENHQMSLRIPRQIRRELETKLSIGSHDCLMTFEKDGKTLKVVLNG